MSDTAAERVVRVSIPSGAPGVNATVQEMAKAAMGPYGAGSGRIRNLAVQIINGEVGTLPAVEERDQRGEVEAIHQWVKDHLRYVHDPLWYEFVTYPETLAFERRDGDCDDFSVLEAALLGAIGIPSRFVTFGFRGAAPSHVALQALVKGEWIPLDAIVKRQPAGWEVPDATTRNLYGISTPTGAKPPATGLTGLLVLIGALAGIAYTWRSALTRMEH